MYFSQILSCISMLQFFICINGLIINRMTTSANRSGIYKSRGPLSRASLYQQNMNIDMATSDALNIVEKMTENQVFVNKKFSKKTTSNALLTSMVVCLTLGFTGNDAFARDLTGTRGDKGFEGCLSKCIFNETKPPPIGSNTERLTVTRSRSEAVLGCKKICATTKEQLLTGQPKVKKVITPPAEASIPVPSSSE